MRKDKEGCLNIQSSPLVNPPAKAGGFCYILLRNVRKTRYGGQNEKGIPYLEIFSESFT